MRDITSHKVAGLNEALLVTALDEPGVGGGNHSYAISFTPDPHADSPRSCTNPIYLEFQNGGIAESGVNGISNEVLLAVVEDRLNGFQRGPYSCRENAIALTHVQDAIHWLHHRTRERIQRGVEGKVQA